MMTNDDAKLLLDENFIATETFDSADGDDVPFFAESKYKKKNDFNFTSLWRKPKIGRRKSKSIGKKQQDTYEKSRGKYVKDRESFDTMASIPLSDFDETKDMLAFLNIRPRLSNRDGEDNGVNANGRTSSLNERKVLNPKMFLPHAPSKQKETKEKSRKERNSGEKLDEEESRDVFKPIHNHYNNFDAFQILAKESSNRAKVDNENERKDKGEEGDDLYDKENYFQESIYCGDLYRDHGPILSSLSEDTINSDSVRGERFLDDNFDEKMHVIDSRNRWNTSNNDFENRKEDTWGFHDGIDQDVRPVETIPPVDPDPPTKIETSISSFSERLKLFQSKASQPIQHSRYDLRKTRPNTNVGNLRNPIEMKHEEKGNKNIDDTKIPNVSELESAVPDAQAHDKLTKSTVPKPDERVTDEVHHMKTSEKNTTERKLSSGFYKVERKNVRKHEEIAESRVPSTADQQEHCKHIDEEKGLVLNKICDSSSKSGVFNLKKSQSKVVDLTLIKTDRNQVFDKKTDRSASSSAMTSIDPTSCLEEKNDWMNARKDSRSGSLQSISGFPGQSLRSHSTKYRSSSNSQESIVTLRGKIFDQHVTEKDFENEYMPEMNEIDKMESSGSATHPSEIVCSNELEDQLEAEAVQGPTKSDLNKNEINIENARHSFMTAKLRFGKKFDQNNIQFGKKSVADESKQSGLQFSESKVSKSDEVVPVDSNTTSSTNVNKNELDFDNLQRATELSDKDAKNQKEPSLKNSVPSMETFKLSGSTPNTMLLESGNKMNLKHEHNIDTMADTTTSSSSCKRNLPTSFAQQSASIFGVTLSKTRKSRSQYDSEIKETGGFLEKRASQNSTYSSQTIARAEIEDLKNHTEKYENNEIQKNIGEDEQRKLSKTSISTYSADRRSKEKYSQVEQEEGLLIIESPISNRHEGTNEWKRSSDTQPQSDVTKPKPRKINSLSISNRLKMFEQATVRNRIGFNRDIENYENTLSPKSTDTSDTPVDDLSVATKRNSKESGVKSIQNGLEIQFEQSGVSSNNPDSNQEDIVFDRRRTLKSTRRGFRGVSEQLQLEPQSVDNGIEKLDAPLVISNDDKFSDTLDDNMNRIENRSKTLSNGKKEEAIAVPLKNISDESSPPTTAYSARKKFFENLDRKRIESSMTRPLFKQTGPMLTNVKSREEYEIESSKDETLPNDEGLPMFVTVEEDFMLRDNISTCLSASETRSVVCKPDALLYSVSQKAIALMSAKAEKSTISFQKSHRDDEKETIHHDLKQNQHLTEERNLNREKSSNDNAVTYQTQFQSRFERKKVEISEEKTTHDNKDENHKDKLLPLQKEEKKKFRTSDFSHRSNAFARKKKTSEISHKSKYDEKANIGIVVKQEIEKEIRPSIGNKEATAPFHRSEYNRLARKQVESKICDESRQELLDDELKVGANDSLQGADEKRQQSAMSFEKSNIISKDFVKPFRFSRKDSVLEKQNEAKIIAFHNDVISRDDEIINKVSTSTKKDNKSPQRQKNPTNTNNDVKAEPVSRSFGSMSIKERRKFFESQCNKS